MAARHAVSHSAASFSAVSAGTAARKRLGRQGVKIVAIVDPGVKYQPPAKNGPPIKSVAPELEPQVQRYYVFDQGMAGNYFQHRKSGQLFIPRVWPGDSTFVDYTLPEARRGILTAATLAWARSLGEFGPILVFSGATRFKTEVLPTTVFLELNHAVIL